MCVRDEMVDVYMSVTVDSIADSSVENLVSTGRRKDVPTDTDYTHIHFPTPCFFFFFSFFFF